MHTKNQRNVTDNRQTRTKMGDFLCQFFRWFKKKTIITRNGHVVPMNSLTIFKLNNFTFESPYFAWKYPCGQSHVAYEKQGFMHIRLLSVVPHQQTETKNCFKCYGTQKIVFIPGSIFKQYFGHTAKTATTKNLRSRKACNLWYVPTKFMIYIQLRIFERSLAIKVARENKDNGWFVTGIANEWGQNRTPETMW